KPVEVAFRGRTFDFGIEEPKCSFPVLAVEGGEQPPDNLHVLLRHRLLREAGGFECLLGIEVGPNRNRPAIFDLGHEGQGRLGLGAAGLATCASAADCDESVSQIPDLRDLDLDLTEGLIEVSEHLADAVVTPKHRLFPPSNAWSA